MRKKIIDKWANFVNLVVGLTPGIKMQESPNHFIVCLDHNNIMAYGERDVWTNRHEVIFFCVSHV